MSYNNYITISYICSCTELLPAVVIANNSRNSTDNPIMVAISAVAKYLAIYDYTGAWCGTDLL